ncbi:hypothetical protein ANCCAN_22600 [Ancylostoma caninum]|uniref:Uncharacterized protein n=1 Tax=Ancylostoma caninum TaxID=29170 RepID=A0A368FHD4_ANCCA|nr:hypothetical protein ANCCAN_22600 [Ancylostoma caninum]
MDPLPAAKTQDSERKVQELPTSPADHKPRTTTKTQPLPAAKTQDSERKVQELPTSPADHKPRTTTKTQSKMLSENSLDPVGKQDFDDYLNALGEADDQGDAAQKTISARN